MKFNHLVKYNGKYYPAGTDVPVGETLVIEEKKEPKYTKTDINRMSTAELKELALANGVKNAEEMTGAELKKCLISAFGL